MECRHDRDHRRSPQRRPRRPAGRARHLERGQRAVHHPRAEAVRGAVRGAPVADRGERRHRARAGGDRVPRHARGAAALQGRRRRHRRRAGALPARARPQHRAGVRSGDLHPGRPQPGAHRRDRRPQHGARAGLRLAVRPRSRQRAPLRHDRGLPELRQVDVHDAVPAPLGRHRLRAGRRAREQAALRHGLRAHALLGQGVHGLGDAPEPGRGHGRDGAGSCSAPTSSRRTP